MNRDTLIRNLEETGQGHVARHLEQLDPPARERLEAQLAGFDYALVERLVSVAKAGGPPGTVGEFEPAPVVPLRRPPEEIDAARRAGEEAIRAGTVAAFVVAGGQGSRLGYDGPKGCYPIGPLSGKSLFQIHAEKVLAAGRRRGADIPLYVMTSGTNDAAVRRFFEENDHFGLGAEDVFFCRQRMIPAFDESGRFLLEAPDRVFVNPDGHGGSYHALSASGAFDHMAGRGIERISYFQVDNPLVPAVDPLFVGEHVRRGSEMSSKVLEKRDALEKLGVFGYVDGELRVVEYSDMSEELQRRRRPDGSLRYRYGSIAVHAIELDFARRMATADLPFHVAHKRIPYVDTDGRRVEPDEPNGLKLERFVFDAVPYAENPLVMEVRREDEFAPVKNTEGEDSPETCRAALVAKHRRWLREAGLNVPDDAVVEISPLVACSPEELAAAELPALGGQRRIYLR